MKIFSGLKIKDKILIVVVLVGLVFIFVQKFFFAQNIVDKLDEDIMIGGIKVAVEVAGTEDTRYKGLSHHKKLGVNEGMLFKHDSARQHEYVMRGMDFDLDFIFIKDGVVVDIAKKVSKEYKGVVKGATDYNKVLEISAGWVERNGIRLGDKVES